MEQQRVRAAHSPARCPYCRDELSEDKPKVACGPCGARHHASCYDEHGSCASCGATEPLRAAAPKPPRSAARPPVGSRIEVGVDGDRTTYAWTVPRNWEIWLLVAMLMVVPPLGIWFLYKVLTQTTGSLVLTPDAIECAVTTRLGLSSARFSFPREEVGAVRVQNHKGAHYVTLDHGIRRYGVNTSPMLSALTAPECEWLVERINAWKDS